METEDRVEMLEDLVTSLVSAFKEMCDKVATLEAMVYNGAAGGAAAAPGGVTTPSVNPALALGSSWHGSPPKRKGSTTSISSKDSMGLGMSAVDPPEAPIYGTCFGYVYKLSSGRGIGGKQWQKRWFVVRDNGMIHYFKSARESTDNMSEFATIDLRGYTIVKTFDSNKPFAFKASKPGSRVFSFAADSEEDRTKWLVAMTDAAEKLQSTMSSSSAQASPSKAAPPSASGTSSPASHVPPLQLQATSSAHRRQLSDPPASPMIAEKPFVCTPESLASAVAHGWMHTLKQGTTTWVDKFYVLKDDVLHTCHGPDGESYQAYQVPGSLIDFPAEPVNEREFTIERQGKVLFTFYVDDDNTFSKWFSSLTNSAQKQTTC